MGLLDKAVSIAVIAHANQIRRYSGLPYIVHPMRVMGRLSWHPIANETNLAAAVLHDTLEDCFLLTENDLIEKTSVEVANLVKELTNPSKGSKEPRALRKAMDREHIKKASYAAKVIKLIDRIDNLEDIGYCSGEDNFVKIYCEESKLLLEVLRDTDEKLEYELKNLIHLTLIHFDY